MLLFVSYVLDLKQWTNQKILGPCISIGGHYISIVNGHQIINYIQLRIFIVVSLGDPIRNIN